MPQIDSPGAGIAAPAPTFNLIGPGRLGQTLTRLWAEGNHLRVNQVMGRSADSVAAALAFIGSGMSAEITTLGTADITLIAVPDDRLEGVILKLAGNRCIAPGALVFHCSGSLSSEILSPLRDIGVRIASVHPLKSFARPDFAVKDFAGTCCACEGDQSALATLKPLFAAIGGRCFAVDGTRKTLYHAGAVLACNSLTALMEAALRSMEAAGIARKTAWPALRPLIEGTLDNIGRLGTVDALTGPVARGDAELIGHQVNALKSMDPAIAEAYCSLGLIKLRLAASHLNQTDRDAISQALLQGKHASDD